MKISNRHIELIENIRQDLKDNAEIIRQAANDKEYYINVKRVELIIDKYFNTRFQTFDVEETKNRGKK